MPREISIEIDPAVRFELRSASTTNSTLAQEMLVGGEALELGEGESRIGAARFGPLEPGSRIEARPDGAFIDGELRAPASP